MKRSVSFHYDNYSACKYTQQREINHHVRGELKRKLYPSQYFLERMGLDAELEGHEGCVNTLEWDRQGKILLSASDDTKIITWDVFARKCIDSMFTVHQGNIFTARFLRNTSNSHVVTGAADYQVVLNDIVAKETLHICNCSRSRVKRIEICPDMPSVFWVASEDGIVRQIDLRSQHTCGKEANNVLINLNNHLGSAEVKCLAVNPVHSQLLALGANDPFVRLYDRRMIKVCSEDKSVNWFQQTMQKKSAEGGSSNEHVDAFRCLTKCNKPWTVKDNLVDGSVRYFIPGHLYGKQNGRRLQQIAVTYVSFSPDGRQLLVNLGSEQIYLFDINNPQLPKYFGIPDQVKQFKRFAKNGCLNGVKKDKENGIIAEACNDDTTVEGNSEEKDINENRLKLPPEIEHLKNVANDYFKGKKYTAAVRVYNYAISKHKTSPVLYGNRAAAFIKREWKGDAYMALRDCYRALELDPSYVKPFFRLCRCLYELGKYSDAKRCLERFKEIFPNHADEKAYKGLERDIIQRYEQPRSSARKNKTAIQVSQMERKWQDTAYDFINRYCGHCNTTTDIKEANFFGTNGQYIIAGSDDGAIYFWERDSQNIVHILKGDSSIVNCLQPNPETCMLATSGIDNVVRIWSPKPEDGDENKLLITDFDTAAENNQKRMRSDPLNLILQAPFIPSAFLGDDDGDNDTDSEPRTYTCHPS